jgi:RNA polymerase sigma factor (TIGR02999 family)
MAELPRHGTGLGCVIHPETREWEDAPAAFLKKKLGSMPDPDHDHATRIVGELAAGDRQRAPELARLVYDNLRRYAAAVMGPGRDGRTLQPTALVNEAYLRLVDQSRVDWQGKTHFFAVGAEMIRRVLVDDARRRATEKRGGGWRRVSMDGAGFATPVGPVDVLALDEALSKLATMDPRAARLVELRFFGGLTEADAAAVLGVSASTARDDWKMARAWLAGELREADDARA